MLSLHYVNVTHKYMLVPLYLHLKDGYSKKGVVEKYNMKVIVKLFYTLLLLVLKKFLKDEQRQQVLCSATLLNMKHVVSSHDIPANRTGMKY